VGTYDVDSPDVQSVRPDTALTCCGGAQRLSAGRRGGRTNNGCRLPDLPATPPDSSSGQFAYDVTSLMCSVYVIGLCDFR